MALNQDNVNALEHFIKKIDRQIVQDAGSIRRVKAKISQTYGPNKSSYEGMLKKLSSEYSDNMVLSYNLQLICSQIKIDLKNGIY